MKRFRIFSLIAFFALFVGMAHAQLELKTNPVALLFQTYPVKAEYVFSPNWGGEVGLKYGRSFLSDIDGQSVRFERYSSSLALKHYFMPSDKGGNRFYALLYNKYQLYKPRYESVGSNGRITRDAVGLALGYKWISRKNITIETALGGGKAIHFMANNEDLSNIPLVNLDAYWRLDLGYRF